MFCINFNIIISVRIQIAVPIFAVIGVSVRLEYGESPEKFNRTEDACDFNGKTGTSLSGPEYESGVAALAEILKVLFWADICCYFHLLLWISLDHVVLSCQRTGTLSS